MKNIVCTLIAAVMFSACQQSLEDRCAQEVENYNKKNCPAQIADNTTIDSLVFERSTHTMHYYYTLSGNADNPEIVAQIDPAKVLLEQIRNSTAIKAYKDAGYNFAYTYHSESQTGRILFERTFTEKDYK